MTRRGEPLLWLQTHQKHEGEDCLIWPFGRRKDGYAWIRFRGIGQAASRVMCILSYGEPCEGYEAAHYCGGGKLGCVNPRHIRWATSAENKADMEIHGTRIKGSKSKLAKLCEADIASIRNLDGKILRKEIGKQFGVSRQAINDIIWGRSWSWF